MPDPRHEALARLIVNHSIALQPGETVMLHAFDHAREFLPTLVDEVHAANGHAVVRIEDERTNQRLIAGGSEGQFEKKRDIERFEMQQVDAYVGVRGHANASELSGTPRSQLEMYGRMVTKPVVFEERVPNTKWVVMRWPTASMAQMAKSSTRDFEDFFFRVCTVDYAKMAEAIRPLRERMSQTDEVRLKGPGTDLRFSIKDIGVVPCEGRRNLPDGECYSAPVRDSVNGTITYNTTSEYLGTTYEGLQFTFEGGRIVKAVGKPQDQLDRVLDSDDGARYIGEFSLGFNPHVLDPMGDTLFDEKIAGSLHFTPGQAYKDADNGNRSQVHWDLVLIQRPEYGGGEIWFDGECVRRDGLFIVPELAGLNPENLVR